MGEKVFRRIGLQVYRWMDSTVTYYIASKVLKDTLSLQESFADSGGIYVFVRNGVTNIYKLWDYVKNNRYNVRFLWLSEEANYQILGRIRMTDNKVRELTKLSFGEYYLLLYGTVTKVSLGTDGSTFRFQSISTGQPVIKYAEFNTPYKDITVNNQVDVSIQDGTFGVQIATSNTTFEELGAGFGYFTENSKDNLKVDHFYFSFLKGILGASVSAHLDLFYREDSERTYISLPNQESYETGFLTIYGEKIRMKTGVNSRLVFARYPSDSSTNPATFTYLTYMGDYTVELNQTGIKKKLLCGLSGMEYMEVEQGDIFHLIPGQSSYFLDNEFYNRGTTAFFQVSSNGMDYYSKPKQAALYEYIDSNLLHYYDMVSARMPVGVTFPMIPYGARVHEEGETQQNSGMDQLDYNNLENLVLSIRERVLLMQNQSSVNKDLLSNFKHVITSQGLVAAVNPTNSYIEYLGIANSKEQQSTDDIPLPDLAFTALRKEFLKSISSNRLFLIMNSDEVLMGEAGNTNENPGSVQYSFDKEIAESMLENEPQYQTLIQSVLDYFVSHQFDQVRYETEQLFVQALREAFMAITVEEITCFLRYCGLLKVSIDGWSFQLSPRNWKEHNTIFLCKYTRDYSLYELVQDTKYWVWKEGLSYQGSNPEKVRIDVTNILNEAMNASKESIDSPYAKLVKIVEDKTWCGCLAFNVSVLFDEVPGEMKSILSGVEKEKFYAHHIGFEQSGISIGVPNVLHQTSMFGLIDYTNEEELNRDTAEEYGFLTKELKLLFYNSKVQYFSCLCQLMLNRLFGGYTRKIPLTTGNILHLIGSYQRNRAKNNEALEYTFSLREQTDFSLDSVPINSIRMSKARMSLSSEGDRSIATITLAGRMKFYQPEKFDPFGYGDLLEKETNEEGALDDTILEEGWLNYNNLVIVMTVEQGIQSFFLDYDNIGFDASTSKEREASLVHRFPMQLLGMITGNEGNLPEKKGFGAIQCPLNQQKLEGEWYGLLWNIDMGSLGSLMKSSSIRLEWLTAWCAPKKEAGDGTHVNPNANSTPGQYGVSPSLYFGVRTTWGDVNPLGDVNLSVGNYHLPLEGVMSLGFQSIQFGVSEDENADDLEYYIRLRNFGLKLLGITFPPGSSDIFLFANPDQTSATKLGWYATYSMGEDKGEGVN
ncbi:hypothetical protein [Anaeromicropila herbilytica]|uniref:Uncharacterized protein n=1 Tax=Anaeromicropila herbilytica TaxID=2785025 RepID=A0A7R7IEJ7_9FIRM|nr:hypothetical protein [Anaeromicropila herbilytica]BCN32179.1 hypothetical protein bsdtb5_34740 [Anaeromicropila herbilytica]